MGLPIDLDNEWVKATGWLSTMHPVAFPAGGLFFLHLFFNRL